jgi:uncharacterized protein YrrD
MASLSELRGRAVISINEGARLGNVKDAALHPGDRQVEGFVLETEGQNAYLPFGNISQIGPDAIMVQDKTATKPATDAEALYTLSELSRLDVMNTLGKKLGAVSDFEFDLPSGALLSIELKEGGVFGLGAQKSTVPAANVRSFGEDVITIEASPE